MSTPREAACAALFALVSNAYAWGVVSRRLKLWNDVAPALRPALFQFEGGRDTYAWSNTVNARRSIEVRLFVYIAASNAAPGAPQINAIADAIDTAMAPDFATGRQTLGGNAFHARIKDVPLKEPGDLDGDGILIMQVEIILP